MKNIRSFLLLLLLAVSFQGRAQEENRVLLRADDFGMSHAVNLALKDMVHSGIPFNASLMMVTPWVQEAAQILKQAPHVSIGLHLTLTSEFEQLKWGPVSGKAAVSSLVDERGYFRTSVKDFLLSDYALEEVETELRAQIDRAMAMGMKVDYLDHHMGIARSTPEIAAVVEKLAREYGLVICRYFDEHMAADIWGQPVNNKQTAVLDALGKLDKEKYNLFVFHTAHDNDELAELDDLNTDLMSDPASGQSILGKHRQAELNVFLSKEFKNALQGKKIMTYGDLKAEHADQMKRGGIIHASIEEAKAAYQGR
ncbi:MAG: ChbG/HpnK family deacetylase [Lutimonas sp.]